MKVIKSAIVWVVATKRGDRLFIWQSKLFATKKEAEVVQINLREAEKYRVYCCRLEFKSEEIRGKHEKD